MDTSFGLSLFHLDELGRHAVINQKKIIGVIDDDFNQKELIKYFIVKSHLREDVVFVSSGGSGASLNKVLGGHMDLLIIDVNLPAVSGFEIGSYIRNTIAYEVPIIYISSDEKYLKEFYRYGHCNSHFMPKPFTQKDLMEVIKSFLII